MTDPRHREPGRRAFVVAILSICLLLCGCSRGGPDTPGNLLRGRAPLRVVDVTEPSRLTDGTIAREGDHWETDLTAVLKSPRASVEWDLGRQAHVRAIYLQGDNNDDFFVSVSDDGTRYREIWAAQSVHGPGMRARHVRTLDATGRYLKITAKSPDLLVSASGLQVFEAAPDPWPPALRVLERAKPRLPGEISSLAYGIITALALLVHRRTFPWWARALSVL